MAVITAAEAMERFDGRFALPIPESLGGGEWMIRRPDLADEILHEVVPMTMFNSVMNKASEAKTDTAKFFDTPGRARETAEFYDKWAVLVAVNPRIVATEEEAATGAGVWVRRVPLDIKKAMFAETFTPPNAKRSSAAEEFPVSPAREVPGPDGEAVQPAAVDTAGA